MRVSAGELDVGRFEVLLEAARGAARDGAWGAAAEKAGAALLLWRGDALADIDSDLLRQREMSRLAEMRLYAQETRIDAAVHLGRQAEVIGELRQTRSPWCWCYACWRRRRRRLALTLVILIIAAAALAARSHAQPDPTRPAPAKTALAPKSSPAGRRSPAATKAVSPAAAGQDLTWSDFHGIELLLSNLDYVDRDCRVKDLGRRCRSP
jgi:hypothetical protein